MFGFRRRLSWMICGWLFCQVAAIALAPLALCCTSMPAADSEQECCPGVGPGQVCPMHHQRERDRSANDRSCKMRSVCGQADSALVALAGGLGVLPSSTEAVNAFDPGTPIAAAASDTTVRGDRPESPPPRS